MSGFQDCLIVQRSDQWWILVGDHIESLDADVSTEELVTCIKVMLKLVGLNHANCLLAPASTSCFFATIQVGEEMELRDRAALTYELEGHVPIDAESMVADFVELPVTAQDPSQQLPVVAAVAVEVQQWRVMADALEEAGFPVRAIVPAAVLVTRSVGRGFGLTEVVELIIVDEDHCDLITVRSESIVAWKHLPLGAHALKRHKLLDDGRPDRVVVAGASEAQQAPIRDVYADMEIETEPIETLLRDGAQLALAKESRRSFDLRRDQLGPSDPLRPILPQVRLVALSAVACLLAMVIGGWWRKSRIESEIARVRTEQQELFREAFPSTKIPGALIRRVRSEHMRVMGSRGASSQVDVPQSAPEVLRALLAALPGDVRFQIKSIEILNGRVDLDLQVRSPVDAGALATSLSAAGFDVEPPVTTQKNATTFESLLEATWIGRTAEPDIQTDASVRRTSGPEVAG